MKLTKQTLKRIIKEELDSVVSEMMTGPQLPAGISDRNAEKIFSMLNSGEREYIEQAKSILDALGASPSFVEDYFAYRDEPGAMEKFRDEYENMYDPDARIEKRPEAYDKLDKIAARHYPDDDDKRFDFSMDMANRAGVAESLKEGIIQQMEAEKILRDEFFRVKELKAQGKATEEELLKAYEDMKNLDKSQFYTGEELASFEAEKMQRDVDREASIDREIEGDRLANQRLNQDRMSALKMRGGYKDRGIDMGPDDPGDVDDLYPDLREGLMYEGGSSILALFEDATLEEGGNACGACLFEQLQEASCGCPDLMGEAEYQGKKVTLNKPTRGDVKKFKVYVKDPSTGNVKKVNFGHGGSSAKAKGEKTMKIRKNNPEARKSFRARHNCDNPGPKTKARYWSCKKW